MSRRFFGFWGYPKWYDRNIHGSYRSEFIFSGFGNDTINAGGGNDIVVSSRGNDVIDGGAGADRVFAGSGNDRLIHTLIDSQRRDDVYNGGRGFDTLQLNISSDQWSNPELRESLLSWLDRLEGNTLGRGYFKLEHLNLRVRNVEALELFVDGVRIDPRVTLQDDAFDTGADGALAGSVAANDSLPGQAVFSLLSGVDRGTLSLEADGAFIFDAGDDFDALAEGATAIETFTYQVSTNGQTYTATASITVTGTNDTPTVDAALAFSFVEDGTSPRIDLLSGARDVDAGADLRIENVAGLPVWATLADTEVAIDTSARELQSLPLGEEITLRISYDIVDEYGARVAQSLTMKVTGTNDAPIVTTPLEAALTEDGAPVSLDLLDEATDVDDGAGLSIAGLTGVPSWAVLNGTTLDVDATHPDLQSLGAGETMTATLDYLVIDEHGASVPQTATLTVTGTNDGPVTTTEAGAQFDEDTLFRGQLSAQDADGDILTFRLLEPAEHGALTFRDDGSFDYTPDKNFNGRDSFRWQVSDGQGGLAEGVFTFNVQAVNDIPVVTGVTGGTGDEDTVINGRVLASDADGDALDAALAAGPQSGTVDVQADGSYSYTPVANFSGEDSFVVRISDPSHGFTEARVVVTVTPVEDAPIAQDDSFAITENETLVGSVLDNDTDADGGALSVTGIVGATLQDDSFEQLGDLGGTFLYTPEGTPWTFANGAGLAGNNSLFTDFGNDGPDAPDGNQVAFLQGASASLSQDFEAGAGTYLLSFSAAQRIFPGNGNMDVRVLVDGTDVGTIQPTSTNYETFELAVTLDKTTAGAAVGMHRIAFEALDSDGNGDSTVFLDRISLASDLPGTLNADGTIELAPQSALVEGERIEFSLTYETSDATGRTDTAVATLAVTGANQAPVLTPTFADIPEDTFLFGQLSATDEEGDGIVFGLERQAEHGEVGLSRNGEIIYTPDADWNGEDSVTVRLTDARGAFSLTDIPLRARAVNDAPQINLPIGVADTTDVPDVMNALARQASIDTPWGSDVRYDADKSLSGIGPRGDSFVAFVDGQPVGRDMLVQTSVDGQHLRIRNDDDDIAATGISFDRLVTAFNDQDFVRVFDTFTNETNAARSYDIAYFSSFFGSLDTFSSANIGIVEGSRPVNGLTPRQEWVIQDRINGQDGAEVLSPKYLSVFSDGTPFIRNVLPTDNFGDFANYDLSYAPLSTRGSNLARFEQGYETRLHLEPGEQVSMVQFYARSTSVSALADLAEDLTTLKPGALDGLTADQVASISNFDVGLVQEYETPEDTAMALTGIAISDVDLDESTAPDNQANVRLTVENGTLTVSDTASVTGLTGNGTPEVSLTGPQAAVNAALTTLVFMPDANFQGSARVTLSVDDTGGTGAGGPSSTTGEFDVTVESVNDAPVASDVTVRISLAAATDALTLVADFVDADVNDSFVFSTDQTGTLGQVAEIGNGTFLYIAGDAFDGLTATDVGMDSFAYTVTDLAGESSTATMWIEILGADVFALV